VTIDADSLDALNDALKDATETLADFSEELLKSGVRWSENHGPYSFTIELPRSADDQPSQ